MAASRAGGAAGRSSAGPPLPRYDLGKVRELRDAIFADEGLDSLFVRLEGAAFGDFVANLAARLRPRGVPYDAVLQTCLPLSGSFFDEEASRKLAWRIAGNLGRLKEGLPASGWKVPAAPEWAPFQIRSARPVRTRKGISYRYGVIGLAGPPSGEEGSFAMSRRQLLAQARELGFERPKDCSKRPRAVLTHPSQLVRFLVYGLVDPEWCRDGRPGFREVRVTATMRQWNRRLARIRSRVEPCPRRYGWPCHGCPVGYEDEDGGCIAAVHRSRWDAGACPACGSREAPIDPALGPDRCVPCAWKV